jgi:tetratricopeptide (TPR) repeat protein
MAKKREWRLTALTAFLGAAAIVVCGAQAPPVNGVCVANCGSGNTNTNTNTTSHAEARAYSSYVKAYNQALKHYQQAIRMGATAQGISLCQSAQSSVDEALQYAPGDGDAQLLRRRIVACIDSCNGTFAVRNGEYDRGVAFYRQAESDDPADRGLWEQSIAWAESARRQAIADAQAKTEADRAREKQAQEDALWEQGNQLLNSNNYKAAEAIWRQVIALDPEQSEAYGNLGYALSMLHRDGEAVEAFRKSIQGNPNNTFFVIRLGISLEVLKRYAEAEQVYRQGMKIEPSDSYSRSCGIRLGYALAHQNRFAEAEDLYRKSLAITPGDASMQHALDYVMDLETKARQQQASQQATPLIQAGENLKDAVNSGTPNSGATSSDTTSSGGGGKQKTTSEALSNLNTTLSGLNQGGSENASAGSRPIFDSNGPKTEAPPVDLRGVGKAPAVVKLLSHIPMNDTTANDKEIKASVDWYSKLESDKSDRQQKIAEVQKQIDIKQGDPVILKIEQDQLSYELQSLQQNQQRAEDAIKKRLKNLSMQWIDEPAPPVTETKPDTGTKEKQP